MNFKNRIIPPKIAVVPATEAHIPYIRNITKEAFNKYVKDAKIPGSVDALNETPEDIKRDIENKVVLVAEVDGTPAGSIRVSINSDNAYISRFGVMTDFQSMGIGKMLLEKGLKYLDSHKIKCTTLHTAAEYTELVRLYNSFGFNIEEITFEKGYARALMKREH